MSFRQRIKCLFGHHRWRTTPEVAIGWSMYVLRECRVCCRAELHNGSEWRRISLPALECDPIIKEMYLHLPRGINDEEN